MIASEIKYVRPEVTELCTECDSEITLLWDTEKEGYKAYCPTCGAELMLCDACRHADDNPNGFCDFRWIDEEKTEPVCFRRMERYLRDAYKEKKEYEQNI